MRESTSREGTPVHSGEIRPRHYRPVQVWRAPAKFGRDWDAVQWRYAWPYACDRDYLGGGGGVFLVIQP